jgi:hypothetical protein
MEVAGKPDAAGIDPNRLLMDVKGADNISKVLLRQE